MRFVFHDESGSHRAEVGIPFGAAIACVFANIYLNDLDRQIERIPSVHYFRYADDLLVITSERESAVQAQECLEREMNRLQLRFKPSLQADLLIASKPAPDADLRRRASFGISGCCSAQVEAWRSHAIRAARFRTCSLCLSPRPPPLE